MLGSRARGGGSCGKMYAAPNKIPTCAHRYRGRGLRGLLAVESPREVPLESSQVEVEVELDIPQHPHGELPEEEGSISQ